VPCTFVTDVLKCGQPSGCSAVLNVSNLYQRSARLLVIIPPDSALGNQKEAEDGD